MSHLIVRDVRDRNISECCGRRQVGFIDSASEFLRAGCPQISVQAHGKVWKRSRIPANALMDSNPVHVPYDAARVPINRVQVNVQGAVEPQFNVAWGSTVTEAHCDAIVTGIEIHVVLTTN